MKGLLIKDFCALVAHFRIYLALDVIFILASARADMGVFMLLFPCIIAGLMAMSILAYEEHERWNVYAATLPYSRAMLVSGKYLLALLLGGATVALTLATQTVAMLIRGTLDLATLATLVGTLLPLTLLPTALLLPFIYRFGAERGRLAYYVVLGVFAAVLGGLGRSNAELLSAVADTVAGWMLLPVSAAVYALSWWISVTVYARREL